MLRRNFVKRLGGVLAFVGVISGGIASVPAVASDDVKVGLVLPLSGRYIGYGQEMLSGFEFVVGKINENGGIKSLDGAKLDIHIADDTSEPGVAALAARKLVLEDKVSVITGVPLVPLLQPILPITEQNRIPVLSFTAGWADMGKHFFTLALDTDAGFAGNFVNFLDDLNEKKNLGIKNVVVASSAGEAGALIDKSILKRLNDKGFNVAGVVEIPSNYADLTSIVLKIRDLRPDAVVSFLFTPDGIKFLNARYALGYNDPVWVGGTGGYTDVTLWEKLGDKVAEAVLEHNLFGMTAFSESEKLKQATALLADARASGVTGSMGYYFLAGAQSAQVLAEALEIAGSAKPEDIEAAFRNVKIAADDPRLYFPRPDGISFTPGGMLTDSTSLIVQWVDGEQVVVWPDDFATQHPKLANE